MEVNKVVRNIPIFYLALRSELLSFSQKSLLLSFYILIFSETFESYGILILRLDNVPFIPLPLSFGTKQDERSFPAITSD